MWMEISRFEAKTNGTSDKILFISSWIYLSKMLITQNPARKAAQMGLKREKAHLMPSYGSSHSRGVHGWTGDGKTLHFDF